MPHAVDHRKIQKHDPTTGTVVAEYEAATPERVQQALEAARNAQIVWSDCSLKQRAKVLRRIAKAIQANADDLAACVSKETGKPVPEAFETELVPSVGVLSYYAKIGPRLLSNQPLPFDKSLLMGRTHYRKHVARGVVGIISPWNFPLATPISGIASSLMAGNAVLLKPSELTPATGERLVQLIQNVFKAESLPIEIIQCLTGDGQTGKTLCEADLDYLIFTGSTQTGRRIQASLTSRGIPCSLELGGSDAMIVLPGADLDAASTYAVWGRFTNAGQLCAAIKRLLVSQDDYEAMLSLLQKKVSALKVGAPNDTGSQMGPLISENQLAQVTGQLEEALQKGARVVSGGKRMERSGYFLEPTILADVFLNARVMTEEVFGPVLPVIAYETPEQAVRIANQSQYGLTASVFGPPQEAEAIAQQLHAGCVVVNDVGATSYAMPLIPWRGWKASGPGGSHGPDSLLELTRQQVITVNGLYGFPLFRKQPWHHGKNTPASSLLGKTLLTTYATESWWDKMSPALLLALWKNRSSQKH